MKKIILLITIVLMSFPVFAQSNYSIKEMTPEVQVALNNRRDRFEQISDLKAKAVIGENNKGYVQALSSDGDLEVIVSAENKDRKAIYMTIAQQNGLEGALSTIEKVFAAVQREKAGSGDKIQTEDGQWVSK